MRIMLVVDNPLRDLPGLILVAAELARNDATVFITPRARYVYELPYLLPDFVLLNYLRKKCAKTVVPLLKHGFQIGVLDTEGGVRENMESFAMSDTDDPELRKRVSCYFSWGNLLKSWLVENNRYTEDQICVSGNPRFDFYVDEYAQAAIATADASLKAIQGPVILCNSVFSSINPQYATAEQNFQSLAVNYGWGEEKTRVYFENQRRSLDLFVTSVRTLASDFPSASFVYRPHPFENMLTYQSAFEDCPNVLLRRDGTVAPWILASRAVVHPGCTTGLEARFAGIESIMPDWIPSGERTPTLKAVSSPCRTPDELKERVAGAVGKDPVPVNSEIRNNIDSVVHDWFHKIDGKSHQRMAEIILDRLQGKATNRSSAPEAAQELPVADTSKYDGSEKYFSAADVNIFVRALEKHVASFTETKIQVDWAEEQGCHAFGYRGGRSVAIFKS